MVKKKSDIPVKIDIGAKAEARLEVKTEIPSQSSGRLLDALTDIIRPFTEKRGLLADQIRLQRAEVAIEIARRAKKQLQVEGSKINSIPNKVLVPLIEAASNEEIEDDYMLDRWGNLLASATKKDKVEPRFVGILRELHGRQAHLFERLALNKSAEFHRPLAHLADAPAVLDAAYVKMGLNNLFQPRKVPPDIAEIYATILDWIDRPGCAVVDIIINKDDDMWSIPSDELEFLETRDSFDLEILSSLGICHRVHDYYRSKFGHEIQVIYYYISELGLQFYFACTNRQPEAPPESDLLF